MRRKSEFFLFLFCLEKKEDEVGHIGAGNKKSAGSQSDQSQGDGKTVLPPLRDGAIRGDGR